MAEIIPLYAVRMADLARGNIEVVAMCGASGHRGIVPPETIRRWLPDKAPILRLRGKLRSMRRGRRCDDADLAGG